MADRVRPGGPGQAQAAALIRRPDARHVADVAAPPDRPAHRLTQCPVSVGQLRRRQAMRAVLDRVKPKICLISHSSP
jgi:hypothetical protein